MFLLGLLMTVAGTIVTIFNWYLALHDGRFYFQAALLGPFTMIFGISGTLFPHRMVPVTTNDLAVKPTKFTKVVLILAIIGGFINFALLISGRVPFSK
jgi:hypothetical protein